MWYHWLMNKITLILPDLHLRVDQADKIIRHVGADEVISLGDIFDDFNDTPEMVSHAAEWYVDFVNKPNHIMLFGNHCQHYAFPYASFQCSGYQQWKYFLINDIVDRKTWDKSKWFHFLDDKWLLTHAGLHKLNVPEKITKFRTDRQKFISELTEWLNAEIIKGFQNGASGTGSWVFNAGHARGGQQRVGGITWCDFDREFFPIRGINQIFGHTPQAQGAKWCCWVDDPHRGEEGRVSYHPADLWKPTLKGLNDPDHSANICLDVHGNTTWAVWNGKELKIGRYSDL